MALTRPEEIPGPLGQAAGQGGCALGARRGGRRALARLLPPNLARPAARFSCEGRRVDSPTAVGKASECLPLLGSTGEEGALGR